MLSTRHSFAIILGIVLVLAILLSGVWLSGAKSEPTETERLLRWAKMDENIRARMQEFLETDPVMLENGISIGSFEWLEKNYRIILEEESRALYYDLYPEVDFDAQLREDYVCEKYADQTDISIARPPLSAESAEEEWRDYLVQLRAESEENRTAFYYAIERFYNLRFADGEKVLDYLKNVGEYSDELLLEFLESCHVEENGYLMYRAKDGTERLVLAWYNSELNIYNEAEFYENDLNYLPYFY